MLKQISMAIYLKKPRLEEEELHETVWRDRRLAAINVERSFLQLDVPGRNHLHIQLQATPPAPCDVAASPHKPPKVR
ncbi:hypothetical protein PFLUV_G00010280 [Perca fluviatilis]|uniref:Uncharacterized protein n=1 Tax=Perca fluviatilis TaxID=8168 RepID=A0A6A5FRP6_PERFL|nr:hypothetical protein PFLUV_G00010280 [Perca fluviatilis]